MNGSGSSNRNKAAAKESTLSLEFPVFEVHEVPHKHNSYFEMIELSERYLRELVRRDDFEESRLRQKCSGEFELR